MSCSISRKDQLGVYRDVQRVGGVGVGRMQLLRVW